MARGAEDYLLCTLSQQEGFETAPPLAYTHGKTRGAKDQYQGKGPE